MTNNRFRLAAIIFELALSPINTELVIVVTIISHDITYFMGCYMLCCFVYTHVPSACVQGHNEQVSIKRFLKINVTDVGMNHSLNALADEAHKQGKPHSDMHSITRPSLHK